MQDLALPKFSLSLLARFALSGPHGSVDLPSKKLAGLLAYLACTAPVPQSREKLATLLWGSHFETQAQQNLRQALFRLRRALGPETLISDDDEVWLAPGVIDCDAVRLQALIGNGSRASLAAAAELYQDPLLADVSIAEEAWADWLGAERQRLEGLALDAMIRHAALALQAGDAEAALKTANRAITVNALREDAHRLVVQALAAAGRKPEALKHYQDLVLLLKRELNTEPDAATRTLVTELGSAPTISAEAKAEVPAARNDAAVPAAARAASPERRQLTIMVCNIAGSAALSAHLDPEDMHDVIVAFHKATADAVSRFDGFVAQYLGDGAHAYFGYPAAHEHDAEHAVRAGLAILDAVGTLKTSSGMALQASIGIATGLVVVGERPGTGDTPQRVAIGEAPSVAVQLQAAAALGEIVISAGTERLVGRMFDCRALAPDAVTGLPHWIKAWQVRGEAAGVSRFDARRLGALSPLVGRQEEADLLLRRWVQARGGEGRAVLLAGEAGIGKSRIAENLLASLKGEPHVRLRYFCSPHHAHSPLYPVIAQLERGFEPDSNADAKLDTLQALFEPTSENPAQDVALMAELLAVPAGERFPALAASPQQKRELTLKALIDQLDGVAAQNPVVILIEDVHWIDPTSLDLLNRVIARAADLPVLLVLTFRPEFQPTWVGLPHVSMLALSRLGLRDSADIVGSVAQGKALPESVIEQILAHAEGVPLFIEELTGTLLESGLLRETTDSYVLDGPLPPLAVPTSLQASLVSRLDRLGPIKDTALIGAAIGREFSYELIAAVTSLTAVELDTALERLTASGLISRRGTPPVATYAFKHALVRDAAYSTLLKSRRLHLHSDIAAVLVARFPAMAERLPEVVALHFTEAGIAGEAIGYWRKAGQLAAARSAGREAVTSFEQALHLLKTQPESQSTLELGCDLRLELRPALLEAGDSSQQMLACLGEAEALAERLNDDHRRARVHASTAATHMLRGALGEALAVGSRAIDLARRLGDLRTRIVATSLLVQVHHARGEYDRVVQLAPGNIAALPADWVNETLGLGRPPSVLDRCWLVMSLAQLGRFAEATGPAAEAIRLAAPMKHPLTVGWSHFAAGAVPMRRGDWAQALLQYERVIAVSKAAKNFFLLPLALAPIPSLLAQLGEASKAQDRLQECERLVARLVANGGPVGVFGPLFAWMGRAALALGRLDDAQRLGAQAAEACRHHPGYAAEALQLLAEIATHQDRFDAGSGEARYRETLALAVSCGMRPLAAHCHLGLGRISRRTGKPDQARDQLDLATRMYREMDMPFWLQQAEAEMPELVSARV